jgi:hypothetical protein
VESARGADITCFHDIRHLGENTYGAAMDEGSFATYNRGEIWKALFPLKWQAGMSGHHWRILPQKLKDGRVRIISTVSPWAHGRDFPVKVIVSEDGGKSFNFVPLYKDGKIMELSGYKSSRTYEFVQYNGEVYALVRFTLGFGGEWAVFRYADGKMHYLTNGFKLLGSSTSRKYFSGEFEFNGACYVAGGGLIKVTDFADQENWKTIPMPGGETVVDAIVRDGVIYALGNAQNRNPSNHNVESYRAVIYKSTTGEEGSFTEVLSFDHVSKAQSLEWDGKHFYIGTSISVDPAKVGMVLRATPKK